MEIIIILLVVGLLVYLFMQNKKDNETKAPKRKVKRKRATRKEINDDK